MTRAEEEEEEEEEALAYFEAFRPRHFESGHESEREREIDSARKLTARAQGKVACK